MSYNDQMSSAVGSLFFMDGGHKETISYTVSATGSSSNIEVIAEELQEPVSDGHGFDTDMLPALADAIRFFVASSALSAPAYGDEITRNGNVFRVRQIESQQGMWVLYCVGQERISA